MSNTIMNIVTMARHSVYTLDAYEVRWMRELAARRNGIKTQHHIRTKKYLNERGDTETHFLGCCAELAVARLLDLQIDESISPRGNQRGYDLITRDGVTIDVRYRNHRDWDFALKSDRASEFKADLAVLVLPAPVPDPPHSFQASGWITRDDFLQRASLKDYGYGPRLMVSKHALHPMASIDLTPQGPVTEQTGLPGFESMSFTATQRDPWSHR